MNKKITLIFATVFGLVTLFAFTANNSGQNEPWPVPDKYEKMKNPVAADKESLAIGKSLYNKHCKSCHGSEGLGDGTKADQLDTSCGDFTTDEFKAQSDGALFYKTYEGRDDMPGYKKKIPDEEDLWSVVNYIKEM
jgi:mono/diheme cytochrome c family protein